MIDRDPGLAASARQRAEAWDVNFLIITIWLRQPPLPQPDAEKPKKRQALSGWKSGGCPKNGTPDGAGPEASVNSIP